jgi:hypothetical protein
MQTMRESWTDERLDDLNAKVDRGFDRVDDRFNRIDERFERMEQRLDGIYRLLLWFCGIVVVALIGMIGSLVGVIVTQL